MTIVNQIIQYIIILSNYELLINIQITNTLVLGTVLWTDIGLDAGAVR